MLKNIISILLVAFLLFGCSDLDKIKSPPKSIKKVDKFVYAEGRWKALPETKAKVISKINFTSITCDHTNMTCEEIESLVITPKDEPLFNKYMLYNLKITYKISNWTNDIIKAKWEAPVADFEITISVKDNFAEKSYRVTKCRGSETHNPCIYDKWMLE